MTQQSGEPLGGADLAVHLAHAYADEDVTIEAMRRQLSGPLGPGRWPKVAARARELCGDEAEVKKLREALVDLIARSHYDSRQFTKTVDVFDPNNPLLPSWEMIKEHEGQNGLSMQTGRIIAQIITPHIRAREQAAAQRMQERCLAIAVKFDSASYIRYAICALTPETP